MIQPVNLTNSMVAWKGPSAPPAPSPLDPTSFTAVLGAREPWGAATATGARPPEVGAARSGAPTAAEAVLPGPVPVQAPAGVWSPSGTAETEAAQTTAVIERSALDYLRKRDDAPRGGATGLRWR